MFGIDHIGCTECTRFLPCEAHRDPRGMNIILLPSMEPRHGPTPKVTFQVWRLKPKEPAP
jgi:hypothetical protein